MTGYQAKQQYWISKKCFENTENEIIKETWCYGLYCSPTFLYISVCDVLCLINVQCFLHSMYPSSVIISSA